MATKPPAPPDAGLQEIAAWQRWFIAAHVQRMRDNGDDDAAVTRERVALDALAAAIAARMTQDYLNNQSRTQS